MAAASAGGIKSGIDPVSGIPQQSLNATTSLQHQQALMLQQQQQQQTQQLQQHHQQQQFIHQVQQQQQNQHHHHNHQQQQQQHLQQQLHHIQTINLPAIQKQQPYYQHKVTVVQPKLNEKLNRSTSGSIQRSDNLLSVPSVTAVSNISASHQNNNNHQLNYDNLTIKKPQVITKGPNVSKGWRRLIIKGDIVYLSPSGSALTSLANVKEYLLKSGTCKCGLPCPLRPEIFFDFDAEVPNRLLRLGNLETSTCSHIDKPVTVQPPTVVAAPVAATVAATPTIVGRRKIVKEWPNSQQKVSTVISSGIIPQNVNNSNVNNSNIISIQKQIKSQNNNSSIVNVGPNVVNSNIINNNNNQIQSNLSSNVVVDSKLSNLKLTRSPPWRKKTNFVAPQNQSSQQHQQMVNEIVVSNNERVPPLPTQHIPINQASQQAVPGPQPNIRIIKTGNSGSGTISAATTMRGKKNPSFKDDPTGYLDHQTAMLQNSILSVPSPDIPIINEPQNVIQSNNPSSISINNNQNPIQIFNNNQHHQVININTNGTNFINQNQHQHTAFPLHSNQILVQQNNSNEQVLHHQSTNQIITNIPQTTTFCGQTVTHMPNGVVQIHNQSAGSHSNQPNSVSSDISIQQQLQIQQQIQQQNQLIRQTQQLQPSHNYAMDDDIHVNSSHNEKLLPDSQQSPVSSSTTIYSQTPDTTRITPDTIMSKGPVQGGTISTSNDSTSSSTSSSPVDQPNEISLNGTNSYRLNTFASSETTSKNTITSVLAGRTMTATTSVNPSNNNFNPVRNAVQHHQQYNQTESYDHQNIMSVANQMPDIQIQQISRDDSSNHSSTSSHHSQHGQQQQQQFIMTSNGQIILMSNKGPANQQAGSSGGNTHQMIINTNNGGSGSTQPFSIDTHNIQSNVQIISQQNMIQAHHKNNQFNNFNNVILSSSAGGNNSNQNLSGNMINPQAQQQTVVLNTIPSGFVIPGFDGSQVIINQGSNSGGNFVQQQIQVSPDSKRRPKKRKNSMSPQSPSPTTIQVPQQNQSMLQIATPQYSQNFQLSPSLSGITIIPNQTHKNPQQQIIMSHQNGQIIQPINLIGQQLLVPAGLVVAPETTLLQIQNCGPILTQQGMVIRAPSPQNMQNKSFLSPNGQGQQFIVNSNGQVSPIGQIYSTPVGLVVPQTNAGQTFVQQNTTIVQQQTTMMNNNNNNSNKNMMENQNDSSNVGHSVSTQTAHQQQQVSSLPPDTTTHSPRSPERPTSSKSIGSNDQMNMAMVQCVSSSEPDSAVSSFENRQSPAMEYSERSSSAGFRNYQQTTFKSSENKIRRIENSMIIDRKNSLDHNIESSSPSATAAQTTTTTTTTTINLPNTATSSNQITTFCIGELVWGSVKGHPAWPAKLINPPDGVTTTNGSTWVKWFGRKPNFELVPIKDLKSLSEGLDAHHRAQRDIRKSRKLNGQLENAIQEAMIELDRISSSTSSTSSSSTTPTTTPKQKYHNRITKNRRLGGGSTSTSSSALSTTTLASSTTIGSSTNITVGGGGGCSGGGVSINQSRINKPIKIAPAPPSHHSIVTLQQQQQAHHQSPLSSSTSTQQTITTINQTNVSINRLNNNHQNQPNSVNATVAAAATHQHQTIQIKCLRSSK